MRSQPNYFEVVMFCGYFCFCCCCCCYHVVFVVVVVLNIDVVVWATSNVDLRLHVMEVEFGWCANPFSCQTQLS